MTKTAPLGLILAHPVNRTSINGVTGFPSRASRKQGETLLKIWWLTFRLKSAARSSNNRP